MGTKIYQRDFTQNLCPSSKVFRMSQWAFSTLEEVLEVGSTMDYSFLKPPDSN